MSNLATLGEITAYLQGVPSASLSWAEGIYSAKLSMSVIEKLVVTMTQDSESPLRKSEEGLLSKEILRINQERGSMSARGTVAGKFQVRLKLVLGPSEQTRVCRIVAGFAQPAFDTSQKFGKSGHAVMNAVRRVLSGYINTKIPVGGSIVEVGPDVKYWMLSPSPSQWAGERSANYKGARPVLTPRDSVRLNWEALAEVVADVRSEFFSEDTVKKARVLRESYDSVFKAAKIQEGEALGEYIVSYDSNYDIAFSDMPVSMAVCRARAWYGVMVRAKGLSSETRLTDGKLDLMGVTYRVDWKAGRIDFRHPECSAFGYSHNVWEYMKYEQHNGFVWTTRDCHYVYSKGPETTDELLFFQVVRVPKVHHMIEPRFIEDPHCGQVELTSLWAVGDEVSGVPSSFQKIVFHVDALNFSKVLEKRRALDHKGNLAVTVTLVRSTNVRFWLHGTPVGVNNKIEARLADATAVVIEALATEQRLAVNRAFDEAMFQYDVSLPRAGWLRDLLTSVIDMKAVTGKLAGPVARVWSGIRAAVIDKALSPLHDVKVGARLVDGHVKLRTENRDVLQITRAGPSVSECTCGEVAEIRAAMSRAVGEELQMLKVYLKQYGVANVCKMCELPLEKLAKLREEEMMAAEAKAKAEESVSDSGVGSDIGSETEIEEVYEDTYREVSKSWSDEVTVDRHEAKSMAEFCELETYLTHAQLVELRIDSTRIFESGRISTQKLNDFSTTRTKHVVLEFMSGRCVRSFGPQIGVVGAIYSQQKDQIIATRVSGDVMYANVPDGFYYTCNRLRVWNGPQLVSAVQYAIAHGVVDDFRSKYQVTLGVPGAGKTYRMMKQLSLEADGENRTYLVLAITKASAKAARKYGRMFGMDEKMLNARVMTLDRYLMHCKFPSDILCVDEFPMVHMGKVDAAASLADSDVIRLFGDARQIPYDPFCSEFEVLHATLAGTVDVSRVEFLPETHRLAEDVCAMWLDQYPSIYPCECCASEAKQKSTCSWEKITDVSELRFGNGDRFHTYKQDEKDDLRVALKMPGDADSLRAMEVGGLATVHEDQGSTHKSVITVRLSVDYDKNESPRNPSLYNRERYVLTDTTRHTNSYRYLTMCDEKDLVCKRVEMSKDLIRLELVRAKIGFGDVQVLDML